MDLKTTIRVESEAKLDAIREAAQELQNAADMAVATSKAQQLLGKEVVNTNKAIQAHIKELQSTADNLDRASDEYKDLQREIERYSSELKSASSAQDKAADSLQDLTNETKELPGNLDKISGGLESMKGFLDDIIIGVGIAAFTTLTDSARELAGQITSMSRSTGISVDNLSRLAAFAKSSGVEFETLSDMLVTLSEKLGDVAKGEGEDLVQALASIGIKATDSSGKLRDTMDILLDVSKAFDVYADGPKKTALAIQLFDDEGANLIGVLSQLHKGFGDLSGALSADFIKILRDSEKASNLLQLRLSQLGAEIGEKLVPILTMLTTGLSTVIDAFLNLPKPVKDAVIYAASLALGLGGLRLAFMAVGAVAPIVVTAVGGFIGTLKSIGAGLIALLGPAGPIALLVAGILGIGGVLYANNKDFRNWFNNTAVALGDRLFSIIVGATAMFGQFAKGVGDAFVQIGKSISDFFGNKVFKFLTNVVVGLFKMFDSFFKWIFEAFSTVAQKVMELYEMLPQQIRNVMGQVGRIAGESIMNSPIFAIPRILSNIIQEAEGLGDALRADWASNTLSPPKTTITRPLEIKFPKPEPEPEDKPKPTPKPKPSPTPKPKTSPQKPDTSVANRNKIVAEMNKLKTDIYDKTKGILENLNKETEKLKGSLKEIVKPFNIFNQSTQAFLNTINDSTTVSTKANEFRDKYKQIIDNYNQQVDLVNKTNERNLFSIRDLTEYKKLQELHNKLKPIDPKLRDQKDPEVKLGSSELQSKISLQQAEKGKVELSIKLIKDLVPEVQKDIGNMLKPQQEQLKTATANLDVIRKTNDFLAQGVAPEQARINALAQIEKEQRKQSLDALEAMVDPLQKALDLAKLTGNDDAIKTLTETINTLNLYITQWDTVNNKIDQHNQKIADAEKQNKQLTERRERNLQIAESIASSIGDGLTDVFDLLLSKTNDWGEALRDIASNVLRQIANKLFEIMVITPIVKAMTAGLGNMFGVSFADGGIMTSRGPVELKKYARGGIANSPQLALFGEGRMPEAYVPLPDGRRIPVAMEGGGSGGGNFAVNVNLDASASQVSDLLLNKTNEWGAALQDIASNLLRQIADKPFEIMVTTPIVKEMTSGLNNLSRASFADGGIMTSRGPVELKTYASGGIANSPQLALFGEGRMPEAYVPLPDGRRIPVAMEGGGSGGGNFTVNVNVDASGSQVSGSPSQGEQLGRAIAQAVQSEIVKQQRPGGLLYT